MTCLFYKIFVSRDASVVLWNKGLGWLNIEVTHFHHELKGLILDM